LICPANSPYRRVLSTFSFLFLLTAFTVSSVTAQNSSNLTTEEQNSVPKFGISAVYAPNSFAGWGKIRNSQSFSIKGQFWFKELDFRYFKSRLGSEIILTQRLDYPLNGIDGPRDQRLGFGLIPAKLLVPMGSSAVRPISFFSAGLLFLNEKLPAGDGASLNYLLNAGMGFEIELSERFQVQLGYSLQHLSNGNTAGVNPGIDYHTFFFTVVL